MGWWCKNMILPNPQPTGKKWMILKIIIFLVTLFLIYQSMKNISFGVCDYNVSSVYQKHEFNSTKWLNATHGLTLNITRGIIHLKLGFPTYGNFTSYNEVDIPNRLSQTVKRSTFNGLLRSDDVYLYKSWNIKDWSISYSFYIDSVTLTDTQVFRCDLVAFTSVLGSEAQIRALNEEMIGMFIQAETGSNDYDVAIHEETDALNYVSDFVELKLDTSYYVTMSKTGTTFNAKIYTDGKKTNKIFDKTLTLHSDWNLAYINIPNSLGFPGNHQITGYVEIYNYSNGIIYTENLLQNTTKKSVMIGMNTSCITNTRCRLYISSDNITWILRLDNNGEGEKREYGEMLNTYSTVYVMVNLTTTDGINTPYLDELVFINTDLSGGDVVNTAYPWTIILIISGSLMYATYWGLKRKW